MAVTSKWRQHIEAWQNSGLSQAEYCVQQRINVRTFTARLSDYRKLPAADSVALVPVQIEPVSVATPAAAVIVFTHVHGHRLELSPSVSAGWVAELLRCLARYSSTDLVSGGAGGYASWLGWLVGHRSAESGAFTLCRIGVYFS